MRRMRCGAPMRIRAPLRDVEAGLEARGKVPAQSTLEEMDELWNERSARGEMTARPIGRGRVP